MVGVRLIRRPDQPFQGTGEPGFAPTVAALAAAIHDAGPAPPRHPFTPETLLG